MTDSREMHRVHTALDRVVESVAKLNAEMTGQLATLNAEIRHLRERLEKMEKSHAREIEAIKAEHAQKIEHLRNGYRQAVQSMGEMLEDKIAKSVAERDTAPIIVEAPTADVINVREREARTRLWDKAAWLFTLAGALLTALTAYVWNALRSEPTPPPVPPADVDEK